MKIQRAIPSACAFVPTMGALHAGHQSLITIARQYCDDVAISVFINPLQFENSDDYEKYPKTPDLDEALAHKAGATILWRPEVSDLYPDSPKPISSGELGKLYEGASRPGHFDGVLTVVNRLFELVQPKYAIFGEKDFQQLFLITEMAAKLHPGISIIAAPTIREESGLAMSSRNVRLSNSGRSEAEVIARALRAANDKESIGKARQELQNQLNNSNFKVDYAEIIDSETFAVADENTVKPRAIVAGWIEGIRLIDNAVFTFSWKENLVRL
ncbi:MAG: pantoate--beta-alanine ligase [Actinobacteria bacterium]|nr:pantoate--beta-alanine ligase [Actinomycetota bacterium]